MNQQTRRTDRDGLEEARHLLHQADQAQASSDRGLAIHYLELALAALDEVAGSTDRAPDGESAAMCVTDNPVHWLDCAEEARTIARQMSDHVARHTLMGIAEGYLRLAERAAMRSPKS